MPGGNLLVPGSCLFQGAASWTSGGLPRRVEASHSVTPGASSCAAGEAKVLPEGLRGHVTASSLHEPGACCLSQPVLPCTPVHRHSPSYAHCTQATLCLRPLWSPPSVDGGAQPDEAPLPPTTKARLWPAWHVSLGTGLQCDPPAAPRSQPVFRLCPAQLTALLYSHRTLSTH